MHLKHFLASITRGLINNIYVSQSGGWEVQDQGRSRLRVWTEPASWFLTATLSLCAHMADGTR